MASDTITLLGGDCCRPIAALTTRPDRPSLILFLVAASVMLTYPFVGTLLAVKRPRNPLGWLLLVLGLGFTLSFFSSNVA